MRRPSGSPRTDLLYAIAAVALVVAVALLTRRLAEQPREGPG